MLKLLPVFVTMLMVLSSMGLMAMVKADAPKAADQTQSVGSRATNGPYSRNSRLYSDISKWRGVKDVNVSVSYLIVTVNDFVDSAKPLAQWKTQKGLSAAIVTCEDIYAHYGGQDKPDQIHNFLRDFRDNNPTFKWLLLLGDSDWNNNQVPARSLYTGAAYITQNDNPPYIQDSTVTDYYYSALDSNFNLNGDNTWGGPGEVDWVPDVYVGRIPAQTAAMATMDINKVVNYEKNPQVGNWMNRTLLAGALYDLPNIIGDYSTRTGEGKYEWWQDNGKHAIDVAENYFPSYMQRRTLFDYNVTGLGSPPHYYGGNYTTPKDELSQATFVPEFNKGYSVIGSASHAWVWSPWATPPPNPGWMSRGIIDYSGDGTNIQYHEFYYWTDAQAASNGNMLPLWYAGACLVGNWSQSSSSVPEETFEQLWHDQNGGVIGLVAASHGDYRGDQNNANVSDGDTWLLENYFKQFFGPGDFRPGQSLYLSKVDYRNYLKNDLGYSNAVMDQGFVRDGLFVYNLQGDPEVPVWTNLPGDLTATISPGNVYTGASNVNVTVKDKNTGLPVENAAVSLWGPTVYAVGTTDASGKAVITTNGKFAEHVNLTVTAHNYKFLEIHNQLNITWKPADLQIMPANITFSKPLIKVGDPVDITATVYNIGETAATNVEVKFYLGDPASGGTQIGTQTINSMAVKGSATVKITWNVLDGIRTICAVADPTNAIFELYKKNNKACNQVEGTNKDLTIVPDDISIDNAHIRMDGALMVANNTNVTVRVKVENKGPQEVPVAYIRVFDGDPTSGGKRIGFSDYPVFSIPAGGNNSTTLIWNVTAGGPHWIFVQIDPTNLVHETDKTNNNASKKVYSDFPPVMSVINDITIDEDSVKLSAFCLDQYVKDPDNTFEELIPRLVSNTNPNVVVSITKGGCVDIIPNKLFHGSSIVTIAVSDGVFEVRRTFTVTVNHINHQPSVTNPGKVTAIEGKAFELQIKANDPDVGDILTYTTDNTMVHINSQTGHITFTPSRSEVGSHNIMVKVSDGQTFNTTVFTIVVTSPDRAPVLVIKEKEWVFTVDKASKYSFNVSDPDNDPIVLKDDFQYGDVKMPGVLAYTPTKAQIGTYTVHISAYDGLMYTNATVQITVKDKPKISIIGGMNMMLIAAILIIIIVVIAIVAALVMRRSKPKVEKGKDKAYDSIYAADIQRKEREELEKRREERRRKDEERRAQQSYAPEAQAAPEVAQAAAPAFDKCPKCGSPKIKQMGAKEWMCMKCGKIF